MPQAPEVERTQLSSRHFPALDGLRGIAVLLVMLYHFAMHGELGTAHPADRVVADLLMAGWSGVDLFFVLSGFLITGILFDARHGPRYFRTFYMRRTLRIFPLYYAVLVLVFFVFTPGPDPAGLEREQVWYWTYLLNFRIAYDGWPDNPVIGHFWTLAVEEQFYLVWPLLVLGFGRRGLMWIASVFIVAAPVLRWWLLANGDNEAAWVLTPARMDALAVGAFLALWIRGDGGLAAARRWLPPGLLLTGALLVVLILRQGGLSAWDDDIIVYGFSLLALLFGFLLLAALAGQAAQRPQSVLASRPLMRIGQLSYALYVFHHPLSYELSRAGLLIPSLPTLWGSQLPGLAIYTLVVGGLTLGLAWLSWVVLERPVLRLKRRFPYKGGRAGELERTRA